MRNATLRPALPVIAAALALSLAGCSSGAAPGSDAAVSSGDPGGCPGEVLDVVVSTGAWSDVVRTLGGDCVTVTTIAPTEAPDEVVPADRAAFAAADLVVVNGARYDDWATDAVGEARGPVVVSAAEVSGAEGPGVEPHLWYDPAVVPELAATVARALAELSPDAAPYFDAQHTAWTAALQPYLELVAALRDDTRGRTLAATGGAFGPMADAVGLTDATPPGYARSARAGNDPAPEDLAEFASVLREGSVDVLVQVGGDLPDQLGDAADDGDVPIVEITELPDEDASFVEWQLAQLGSLAEALTRDR